MSVKISIITATSNSAHTIEKCIHSLKNQSYSNLEYILIDNDSSDGTQNLIAQHEKFISRLVSEPDDGVYSALNKGIKLATGDLIGFLHSDDIMLNGTLNLIAGKYRPDTILTGQLLRPISDGAIIIKRNKSLSNLKCEMAINHPATFVPAAIFRQIGLFDTNYTIAADYKFICQCWLNSIKFEFIEKPLVQFAYSGLSDRQRLLSYKENRRIQKELKLNNPLTTNLTFARKVILLPFKRALRKFLYDI
ncbi:MAG: glycosyltransferase family 2 protein [Bacteroidota bacterium]